jgi:alanine dehydrogenase
MWVGIPREVKTGEKRVALLPQEVRAIVDEGHDVQVETRAGLTVGFDDEAYRDAGAMVVTTRDGWIPSSSSRCGSASEDLALAQPASAVLAFHLLVGEPQRTRAVAQKGLTAIAYERMHDARGTFPLLAPMSRIAGRMAPAIAHSELGRPPARVLVLGAGAAGRAAAEASEKLGAQVTALRRDRHCRSRRAPRAAADLVVGAVYNVGQPTPKLLPRTLVARMKRAP